MRSWKLDAGPPENIRVRGKKSGYTYAVVNGKWSAINPATGKLRVEDVDGWDEHVGSFWHWHDLLEAEGELTEVVSPPKVGVFLNQEEEFERLPLNSMLKDEDGILYLRISKLFWFRVNRGDITRLLTEDIPQGTLVYLDA